MEDLQRDSRHTCKVFFDTDDAHARLQYIYNQSFIFTHLMSIIDHFLTKQDYNVASVMGDQPVGIKNAFSWMLFSRKKLIFDINSTAGKGLLEWEGEVNPNFCPCPHRGDAQFPIAALNVLRFMIQIDADKVFWENFEDIKSTYELSMGQVKKKYANNHHERVVRLKHKIAEEIFRERGDAEEPMADDEDVAYLDLLTREERMELSRRVREAQKQERQKKKIAEIARKKRNRRVNDKTKHTAFTVLQ